MHFVIRHDAQAISSPQPKGIGDVIALIHSVLLNRAISSPQPKGIGDLRVATANRKEFGAISSPQPKGIGDLDLGIDVGVVDGRSAALSRKALVTGDRIGTDNDARRSPESHSVQPKQHYALLPP